MTSRDKSPQPIGTAPSHHRLLIVTQSSGRFLLDADALSEYDGVITDQCMERLANDQDLCIPPGQRVAAASDLVIGLRHVLRRRTTEAAALLARGGVLAVRLQPLSELVAPARGYALDPGPDVYTQADWWIGLDQRLAYLRHNEGKSLVHAATGPPGRIQEPGHSLEPYLRDAQYTAVLDTLVTNTSGTVLATNRGGEAIAAQFEMGSGLLLLIPSGGDEGVLEACVSELLDLRTAYRTDWLLPDEAAALADLNAAETTLRVAHAEAVTRLLSVRELKQRVFTERTTARVLDYYRTASAEATSRPNAVARLHSMVEVLEAEFEGESALRKALSLNKSAVEAIKHLANRPDVGARHVDDQDTRSITNEELESAMEAARQIVQAYIEYRVELG